jgi:hypothetical protein
MNTTFGKNIEEVPKKMEKNEDDLKKIIIKMTSKTKTTTKE